MTGLLCAPPAKKKDVAIAALPPKQNKRAVSQAFSESSSRDAPAERIPSLTSGERSKKDAPSLPTMKSNPTSTVSSKPTSPPRSDASRDADRYRNDDDYDAEEDIYADYAPFVAKKKKGGK